jgi:hypothetical protein
VKNLLKIGFLFLQCFNFILSGGNPSQKKLHDRYHISPEERCKQATCQDEKCVQLIVLLFSCNQEELHFSEELDKDKKRLSDELQEKWLAGWIFSDASKRYAIVNDLIKNNQLYYDFLNQHDSYIQAQKVMSRYRSMLQEKSNISRSIRSKNPSEQFPFCVYDEISRKDLQFIQDFQKKYDKKYPALFYDLYQLKEHIEYSREILEAQFNEEWHEQQNRKKMQLEQEKLSQSIINQKELVALERDKKQLLFRQTQAIEKRKEEEKRENEQLLSTLRSINWNIICSNFNHFKARLEDQIKYFKNKSQHNDQMKKEVEKQLDELILKLKKFNTSILQNELKKRQENHTQSERDLELNKKVISILEGIIKTKTSHHIQVVEAAPVDEGDQNIPIVRAEVIPYDSNPERCTKK